MMVLGKMENSMGKVLLFMKMDIKNILEILVIIFLMDMGYGIVLNSILFIQELSAKI